jgi:hypothetical protein
MKKDNIVQFVCFITNLEPDTFIVKWEEYASQLIDDNNTVNLLQNNEAKAKFRYISQHDGAGPDFRFAFMKKRNSEHFAEQKVKVIQAGGYITLQVQCASNKRNDARVIVFVGHDETDIDFYSKLSFYRFLNIHQAYYESSLYGYVLEFYMPDGDAPQFLEQLKDRHGIEASVYTKCLIPHV